MRVYDETVSDSVRNAEMNDEATLIARAFELRNGRGVALLASLGRFDVWRGDLAAMRGDAGRPEHGTSTGETAGRANGDLETVLAMSLGLRYLQPRCHDALYLTFVEKRDHAYLARALETTPRYAEKLVENCVHRLKEIVSNITSAGATCEITADEAAASGATNEGEGARATQSDRRK